MLLGVAGLGDSVQDWDSDCPPGRVTVPAGLRPAEG